MSNDRLEDAPNLGKIIAQKLIEAEIPTMEDLRQLGAEQAFTRLITIDSDCPVQMLYALEGAIEGIRWHNLSTTRKEDLKIFFQTLQLK